MWFLTHAWIIPALPALGFVLILLFGKRFLGPTRAHWIGVPLIAIAFVLAIWMVVCNMRVQVLAWPLALTSSLLYFLLFWSGKLYGEASLQLLFAALALWGWWQWLRGRTADGDTLHVRTLGPKGRVTALLVTLAAWPLLGLFLQHRTDSLSPIGMPSPRWPASPASGCWAGSTRRTGPSG